MEGFQSVMEAFFRESQLFESLRSTQPDLPKEYVYELQPQSSLLNIPAELREEVLKYLLVSTKENNSTRVGENPITFPAVLRVCRQLYIEGQPFYQNNTFHIDLYGMKRKVLLPSPVSPLVANINPITFDDFDPASRRSALRHLHRLSMRHISIDVEIAAASTHQILETGNSKDWFKDWFEMRDRRVLVFRKSRRSRPPKLRYEDNIVVAHRDLRDWAESYSHFPARTMPVLLSTPKDLTWLFKQLGELRLTEVRTLTLNLKGIEGWLYHFSRCHRPSRFEELPQSTLIYAIIQCKPAVDKIVVRGPKCKALQEFVVSSYIHRQADCCKDKLCRETTAYDPSNNHLLVVWPVVRELVERGEPWDEDVEHGIRDTDLVWETDSESLWEAWRIIQRYDLRYEVV